MSIYLRFLVFWCGLVTLGVELSASRLLAPFFGTSLVVWSSLIGLILVGLAAGYWLGGQWADRSPRWGPLLFIVALSGLLIGLVPALSRPILGLSLRGFAGLKIGLLAGSFFGTLSLLGVPMILLGMVTPFAMRLATRRVEETGRTAGQLIALSTLGSFLGSFLPVMVLIPAWGTRNTFLFFSVSMLLLAALGSLVHRRRIAGALSLLFLCGVVCVFKFGVRGPIKAGEGILFEGESAYQYIRVREDPQGWRYLELNEGIVTHSKYHPRSYFTGGEWDYMAVAPFFNPRPFSPLEQTRRWAIIGSGAGTSARLITRVFGPVEIDGVEIDPDVVETGRKYFDMNSTNLHVSVLDGRAWLTVNRKTYDVVVVDAYRQPYIPFELATLEFFRQVRDHLSAQGVVAINVARSVTDQRLVNALAATLRQVFPSVFLLDLRHRRNTVMVASRQTCGLRDFIANTESVDSPELKIIIDQARNVARLPETEGPVLTDDRAPVERLTDQLIFAELFRRR